MIIFNLRPSNEDSTKTLFSQYLEGKVLQRLFIWAMCLIVGNIVTIILWP